MPDRHTKVNLDDLPDVAPGNGFGDRWEARAPREALGATMTGLTHLRLHPGKRSPFVHRERRAEEIYVVLSGTGFARLDGELQEIGPRDAIRVDPEVGRAFEAGPDGLELLAFGPHDEEVGLPVDDDWTR